MVRSGLASLGVVEIERSAGHAERLITRSMDRIGPVEAATAACPVGLNWRFDHYIEHDRNDR